MRNFAFDETNPQVCPFSGAKSAQDGSEVFNRIWPKSDELVLQEIREWMARQLPCVAGRREFNRGKYMIRLATRDTVRSIFDEFRTALPAGDVAACLFVFNAPRFYEGLASAGEAFTFLAEQMEPLSAVPAAEPANGASMSLEIHLECPVTGLPTSFDDFEGIAFCPQSSDLGDLLYDPLMAMPYTCVNLASDVYGFSRFVRDSAMTTWGCEVYEQRDLSKIEKLFDLCVDRWQRVAAMTISNYQTITDTTLCPVQVIDNGKFWIAAHKDPAFAEQIKSVHKHELPQLYARRIVDGWLDYFKFGREYRAKGLAREGCVLNHV